jgi:hypothetical protein
MTGGWLSYRVAVPANAVARVHVPSADPGAVRDAAGRAPSAVAASPGVGAGRAGEAVFLVGPGQHEFSGPDIEAMS